MLTIGLTGGIGSGKTSVSNIFEELKINIIDTDVISRELLNNDSTISQQVANAFDDAITNSSGIIDRKKLARCIFNNKVNKTKLEAILHPKIRDEVDARINKLKASETPPNYIIVVIPLLLETNFLKNIDRILVVLADEETRVSRVQKRDNRDEVEIRSIIGHQVDDDMRNKTADDIISNNGNITDLEAKVKALHTKYLSLSKLEE